MANETKGVFTLQDVRDRELAGTWIKWYNVPYHPATIGTSNIWFGGGSTGSGVDRVIFASDTSTAVAKGPLSLGRSELAAHGNTTDAWFGGGDAPGTRSTVDRIIFSSDTSTAVAKGPLSSVRRLLAAHGNTTDAWFGGGRNVSRVDRIIFLSDTATAVAKGPLSAARLDLASN